MKIYKIISLVAIIFNINSNSFASNMTVQNAHLFSFKSIDGKEIKLSDFKGRVVLIVNTASKCGFTPQYFGLQELYESYKDKGLVVIGVPSPDFANQEFGLVSQVKEFTETKFHVAFPLTEISKVKGKNAHPFYLWANSRAGSLGSPKWNFHKYLIDKNGNFVTWYSSMTKPQSSAITNKIEELL